LFGIGCSRLIGQRPALLDGGPQRVSQRAAQPVRGISGVVGLFADSINLVHGAHVVVERDGLADQPARVGQRRFCGSGCGHRFLRIFRSAQNLRNRSRQPVDLPFKPAGDLTITLYKRRHLLDRIENLFLQVHLAFECITLGSKICPLGARALQNLRFQLFDLRLQLRDLSLSFLAHLLEGLLLGVLAGNFSACHLLLCCDDHALGLRGLKGKLHHLRPEIFRVIDVDRVARQPHGRHATGRVAIPVDDLIQMMQRLSGVQTKRGQSA
jgi:hypothetical protein